MGGEQLERMFRGPMGLIMAWARTTLCFGSWGERGWEKLKKKSELACGSDENPTGVVKGVLDLVHPAGNEDWKRGGIWDITRSRESVLGSKARPFPEGIRTGPSCSLASIII